MPSKKLPTENKVSAAILAGGEGSRMGYKDKSCLEISGEKIVSRIIRQMSGLFSEIFVITRTPEHHPNLGVRLVGDIYQHRSSLTGIHAAISHAETEHVFITACDSPFLNKALVTKMLSLLSPSDDVLIPIHDNWRYEPLCAIYSKRCLPFIEENLNNEIFQIIRFFPEIKVHAVDAEILKQHDQDLESFINVNTPEELSKACERAKKCNKI
ncbi:molybdenum cofactor guanylyltransferase [Maridesulfovibrio ferrireducens]|uniref:molybdenum cofactor guanylyltransferase n=1 Tax=Maridesulfovibrio ferrireducens TaxID=246191 RepID=UPI001A310251|nr:molybdenum cofactor guanylyltransferase [Maridesulfovibrio ferrireducens]MBI9110780.1 molybdenum cofactor guanylyltransferase [Maridesulfovibrio ferrireducens]